MKIFLLATSFMLFNIMFFSPNSYAHKPHQDKFLQALQQLTSDQKQISPTGLSLVKNNIKDFNYEAHYSNPSNDLEQKLYLVLSNPVFNIIKYRKTMKNIFGDKPVYKDTSTKTIAKLSQHDRIILFKAMQKTKYFVLSG